MKLRKIASASVFAFVGLAAGLACLPAAAQTPEQQPPGQPAAPSAAGSQSPAPGGTAAPLTLTLQDALERARSNTPEFRAALTNMGLAHEDTVQARAGLLPTVNYNTQFIYTQGNNTSTARFFANNGVHEYIAQGNIHADVIDVGKLAEYRSISADEAIARANAEIATRGLLVTVVQDYYGLVASERKFATAQRGSTEGENFLSISQKLEQGGEVAHSDAIKAEIQYQQKKQALREAQLDMERARLALAVIIFPNFNQNFTVVDDLQVPEVLPAYTEVLTLGSRNNPELRAAKAALDVANLDVVVARSGYLPTVTVDYFYGIDSNHFATKIAGVDQLGYSAIASFNLPIWNWGATHSKVKQADLRRKQARTELSFAQRQLLSNLQSFYHDAEAARAELDMLARAAELSSESLRLTTLRYQASEASVLDVVDAQNTLVQARDAYDDGQVRYRVSIANLKTLTGNF